MYLGFSIGTTLDCMVVALDGPQHLGTLGAVCEVSALGLFVLATRRARRGEDVRPKPGK